MRAMILYEHCSPHQVFLVTEAQRYFEERQSTLIPVEFYGGLRDYSWTLKDSTRPGNWHCLYPECKEVSSSQLYQAIRQIIREQKAEVVFLNGWYNRLTWMLAATKCLLSCQLVMVSDSVVWDYERVWHKELLKKWLISRMDAGFVAGTPQKEYLSLLGLHPAKITMGNDAVDNSLYSSVPLRYGPENRTIHIGTAARMIPVKNLQSAMSAFACVLKCHPQYSIIWHLAGTGPLEQELKNQAEAENVPVIFHGFVGYADMPLFYAQLDCYWQPSLREPWGLVVNEAMASGLPVLVSDRCGCAIDLVQKNVGWVHESTKDGMIAGLVRALSQSVNWPVMGQNARGIISNWGSQRFSQGLYQAAKLALLEDVTTSV